MASAFLTAGLLDGGYSPAHAQSVTAVFQAVKDSVVVVMVKERVLAKSGKAQWLEAGGAGLGGPD